METSKICGVHTLAKGRHFVHLGEVVESRLLVLSMRNDVISDV